MDHYELIRLAKQALAIDTDYKLGKIGGFSPAVVSRWKHGSVPDDEHALKLAEIAGLPGDVVLMWMNAERTNCPAAAAAYLQAADTLQSKAA